MLPKYVRSGRRGIGSLGHFFLHSLSATECVSFALFICWKLSIADITAISYKNKTASSKGWFLAG